MFKILNAEQKDKLNDASGAIYCAMKTYNNLLIRPYLKWATKELTRRYPGEVSDFGDTYENVYKKTVSEAVKFTDKEIVKYYREKSIFVHIDGPQDTKHLKITEEMHANLGMSLYLVFNPETAPKELFGSESGFYENRLDFYLSQKDEKVGFVKNGCSFHESDHFSNVAKAIYIDFSQRQNLTEKDFYDIYKKDPDTVKLTALKRYWDAAILVLQQSRRFLEPAMKYVDKKMWFEAEIYVKKLHVCDFADLILKMKTFEEMQGILFEAEDYAFATMRNNK